MSATRARFYREVDVGGEGEGFCVLLDGKKLKTPAGAPLVLPTRALAEAVAQEWRAQGEKIRPETMGLTNLAATAIDRVPPARAEIVACIVAYGKTDHLCYRAEAPEALRALQAARWDPLLDWARAAHSIAFACVTGIMFAAQPEESLQALERAVTGRDDFALAALQSAAGALGSAILALALADAHIAAQEAASLARLDEDFQAAIWGRDAEAERSAASWRAGLADIGRFLLLLKTNDVPAPERP